VNDRRRVFAVRCRGTSPPGNPSQGKDKRKTSPQQVDSGLESQRLIRGDHPEGNLHMKNFFVAVTVVCFCGVAALAQNSNSSSVDPSSAPSTRTRTMAPAKPSPTPRTTTKSATTQATPSATPRASRSETPGGQTSPSGAVLAAF